MSISNRLKNLPVSFKRDLTMFRNKKFLLIIAIVLMMCCIKVALASDVDLSSLDESVEGHIKGDWGRLIAYITLGSGLVIGAIKQSYLVLFGSIIILIVIGFFPGIIDSATGG